VKKKLFVFPSGGWGVTRGTKQPGLGKFPLTTRVEIGVEVRIKKKPWLELVGNQKAKEIKGKQRVCRIIRALGLDGL